nr:restriction endonuclease subunit S [uncultured Roseovarius sp.]
MLERPTKLTSYRFDQLADQVNQRVMPAEADVERYVGLEHLDPDSLRIRRWGDPSEVESTKLRFEPGDIIFGKRRVYQRKVAVADTEGICSAHAMVLRAKPDTVLPEFLPFFMQSDLFMERALSISVGSLSPTINWKALAKEEFLLPPIQEQARLVEALSAARDVVESLKNLHDASSQSHVALCRQLFRISNNGRPPSAADMPDGWQLVSLADVVEFQNGKRVPLKSSDRSQRQGEYPYYGASGVIDHIDAYIFEEDLVLLSEDGANLVDRSTPIAFIATGKYWVNNHAHVLRPIPPYSNELIVEYMDNLSLAPFITGSAQPKLNKAAAEKIPIPMLDEISASHFEEGLGKSRRVIADVKRRLELAQALQKHLLLETIAK